MIWSWLCTTPNKQWAPTFSSHYFCLQIKELSKLQNSSQRVLPNLGTFRISIMAGIVNTFNEYPQPPGISGCGTSSLSSRRSSTLHRGGPPQLQPLLTKHRNSSNTSRPWNSGTINHWRSSTNKQWESQKPGWRQSSSQSWARGSSSQHQSVPHLTRWTLVDMYCNYWAPQAPNRNIRTSSTCALVFLWNHREGELPKLLWCPAI